MTAPSRTRADQQPCWYADGDRRPAISRCPAACNGRPTHAERQGDGIQRFYCEGHAHWRASDVGKRFLRPLRAGELA